MPRRVLFATLAAVTVCAAQEGSLATFGTTVVIPGGLTGKVYEIPPSESLPKLDRLEPVGTLYAKGFYIPPRDFSEGFPGVTTRVEWFALDFTGRFYIAKPGSYGFRLASDDGSNLYIDGKRVIDNDGIHGTIEKESAVKLAGGVHTIRVTYFQGPRYHLSLMLSVAAPGDRCRPFNTDNFQPPANPADWKYGSPTDLKVEPDPDAGRRRLTATERFVSLPVQAPAGLTAADFAIRDNGELQAIADFTYARHPLDIVLLVDTSAHLHALHQRFKDATAKALPKLDARDRVAVIQFAGNPAVSVELTPNRNMVLAGVRKIRSIGGESELNAAIAVAAHYLQDRGRSDALRAIVVLTEGSTRAQQGVSERATRDALWQSRALISGLAAEDTAAVRPFVDATGGDLLAATTKNVPLAEIFQRLRERYLITWRAPAARPRTIRTVAVDVPGREARVRAPGGYVVE